MWQAEVLQRQGSWVTRHEDEDEARKWINDRIKADKKSVNPVRKEKGRHVVNLILIHDEDERHIPIPPEHSFDDEENGWKP